MSLTSPVATLADAPRLAESSRHVAGLDGLRAFAVLGVLLMHVGTPGMELGGFGVDLFFVLSGFLITTLLVREWERTGRISMARFWGRRALRLMPAYWLYASFITASICLAHWGWMKPEYGGWTPGEFVASIWLYCVNYVPQGGLWEHQSLVMHCWSLAVEEQFYFLWPPMVLLLIGRGRIEWVAWGLVLASAVLCMTPSPYLPPFRIYTRGLGIMMGCAFALTAARSPGLREALASPRLRASIAWAAALAVAIPSGLYWARLVDSDSVYQYFPPAFNAAMALLVAMLWYGPGDAIARALSWRPLAYAGRISYGIYLYHMLARYLTWSVILPGIEHWNRWAKFGLRLAVFLALTMALAMLSYHLLERPFLKLKARLH